jgi:ADP-ribosylglycohydrolase
MPAEITRLHGRQVSVAEPPLDDEPRPQLPWLADAPSLATMMASPRSSRIAATILGAAIGDAMGHPTEFIDSVAEIRCRFGPHGVTGFELYWTRDSKRFAPYTDDTQMAELVLRSLLWAQHEHADLDATMVVMADAFVHWSEYPQGGHRAPGSACMAGCRALASGEHWSQAGGEAAGGCGSVMRAYPFGLVFAGALKRAETWAVAHSRLTHNDPIALAACAAMAVGVARNLRGDGLDVVLRAMVAAARRHSESTATMMLDAIDEAQRGIGPEVTLDRLRGWAAHEAVAAAAYLLARHCDDPRAAILEGANTPGDSDSLATLAGALVGARTGLAGLPEAWVREVERSDVLLRLAAAV